MELVYGKETLSSNRRGTYSTLLRLVDAHNQVLLQIPMSCSISLLVLVIKSSQIVIALLHREDYYQSPSTTSTEDGIVGVAEPA